MTTRQGNSHRALTLIVDDDPHLRESLRDILEHEGYVALEAGDGKTALELLDQEPVDLLLLDLELPRVSGINVLRELADRRLDIPVVIISAFGSVPKAVTTTKLGAYDFIEKPLDAQHTLLTVRNALEESARRRARRRSLQDAWERYRMVGSSAALQRVYQSIDRAAATRAKVLVMGESGTGKELAARAVHRLSARAEAPFVALNCAAVPETLIESEVFGHDEGAFTGARGRHRGKFEQAHGGTLLLDEIGDMSLMTQAKVLRVLESGEIQRVGGEEAIKLDVRLIAATNRDLAREVEDGNFREDLYYRISVITIQIPPLRERREDIPELARHFCHVHGEEHGRASPTLTSAAMGLLIEWDWPGNVRELSNVVERVIVLGDGEMIDARDVREALRSRVVKDEENAFASLRDARERFERDYITSSLLAHEWRIQETADALEINRSHLWKKMKQLGISAAEGPDNG